MTATYTVKQVAQLLGYSTNSIYTFLKGKRIKGVRLGKGRFRIPQSEIDRLMQTQKSNKSLLAVTGSVPSVASLRPVQQGTLVQTQPIIGDIRVQIPSLFDWFIATSAVVTGVALFLFNQSTNPSPVAVMPYVAPFLRWTLIIAGIGSYLSSVSQGSERWHKLFHGILMVGGSFAAIGLWKQREFDGALIYASLALVIGLSLWKKAHGRTGIQLYMSLLAIVAAIVPMLTPRSDHIQRFMDIFNLSPWVVTLIFGGLGVGFIFLIWNRNGKMKFFWWASLWVAGFACLAVAFWYAQFLYWSRAFFFITLGFTSLFLPIWEELKAVRTKRQFFMVHGLFGGVFAVLFTSVLIVSVIQFVLLERTKTELVHRLDYGKIALDETITTTQNFLVATSRDNELIKAVEADDKAQMNRLSRQLFESSTTIRRIVILDAKGQGISLYPFGTFDQTDLSFRDYYIETKKTGLPYISSVFQALVDQSGRQVVVVAVPILKSNGEFVGVLTGSLDLEKLSHKLDKIAMSENGEYFLAIDREGKRVIHPDMTIVGTEVPSDHPARKALDGERGVGYGENLEGEPAVIAYDRLQALGWSIALVDLIGSSVRFTDSSTLTVFIIVIAVVSFATITLMAFSGAQRVRTIEPDKEGDSS